MPGAGDLVTRRAFGDFQLHLEFWLPETGDAVGQARANSGAYLQGRYEIQILDSFELAASPDGCGAIYGRISPLWNACRKPEVWQTLDVAFRARRRAPPGDEAQSPRATVLLNGILIHNNVALTAPTAGGLTDEASDTGPVRLQDHGNPVRFRNVWLALA